MDPAVVSQRAGDSHGMLDDDAFSNGGGGGDGGARPAALKEEGEDKQRFVCLHVRFSQGHVPYQNCLLLWPDICGQGPVLPPYTDCCRVDLLCCL